MWKAAAQKLREYRCVWNGHDWPCIWAEVADSFDRTAFLLTNSTISCARCNLKDRVVVGTNKTEMHVALPAHHAKYHNGLRTMAFVQHTERTFKNLWNTLSEDLKKEVIGNLPKRNRSIYKKLVTSVIDSVGPLIGVGLRK